MSINHTSNAGDAHLDLSALQTCSEEPIRVPGSVQQHGFFLAFDEKTSRVTVASDNAERFLGLPLRLVLGARLDAFLPREVIAALSLVSAGGQYDSVTNYLGSFLIKGELFSIVTFCNGDRRVLELELQDALVSSEMMNGVVTNFVGTLTKITNTLELCQSVARQVHKLTGLDRVMVYRFDETGVGTVLAEETTGALPSFIDLRFPATDIPQQARELYVLNTVRIIPDANYTPSPLVGLEGEQARTMDLSLATLRSVSPVHLQYMRNMGTMSSMSISIVNDGKLWGLISGHHSKPYRVPYLLRSACDMLAKLVVTQLNSFVTAEQLSRTLHFHSVQRALLTEIAAERNYVQALTTRMGTLREVVGSEGIALLINGEWFADGRTPAANELTHLVEWLDANRDLPIFHTRSLSQQFPWAEKIREMASGVIVARISDVKSGYVMWFRPEIVETVKWAGDPIKAANDAGHLSPRTSFEAWKETVRGQSAPWTDTEVQSASDFRAALVTISLRHAEEEAQLHEARFQNLTQTLPTKIFTTDDAGMLNYTNNRWVESGLKTTGLWFESNVHEEDIACVRQNWEKAVAAGTEFREEMRMHEGDGERLNFVHAVPLLRVGGLASAGWVASCTDLTESREREVAIRMTEKLALTGRMTSVIAHEINNPLESITNLMYLLRTEIPDTGPAHDYVGMAESELLRISGITKQTLRWNRETPGDPEWMLAGVTIEDVMRLFRGKIRNRHVVVDVSVPDDVRYFGISGQIRQVIANLLSNAIDGARVGGNVWISGRVEGTATVLQIRDDGVGMDDQTKAQLFKPFFSTKGDLGNGLGLYISHEIVERHGGNLTVESELGKGTVARVSLPRPA